MRVAVHGHLNARLLCEIELSDDEAALLAKPPALKDNLVRLPDGRVINAPKPEDHVVTIGSGPDRLLLFPVAVNGQEIVVTSTPEAALARAIA